MPVSLTYPGVYIEEVKSGVRTITGVATSIAAFVGLTPRGPTDAPVTIFSFGDFQRTFGGLAIDRPLGFAVRDFFVNGGSQAVVVRVAGSTPPTTTPPATPAPPPSAAAEIAIDARSGGTALLLVASNPGAWGNNLAVVIDYETKEKLKPAVSAVPAVPATATTPAIPAVAAVPAQTDDDRTLFSLTVMELDASGRPVQSEQFVNVAFDDASPRYLPRVLNQESTLVRAKRNAGDTDWLPFTMPKASEIDTAKNQPKPTKAKADSGQEGEPFLGTHDLIGNPAGKKGIFALEHADLFNLLCIPPYTKSGNVDTSVVATAADYCQKRRAMLLVDPPSSWVTAAAAFDDFRANGVGTTSSNAALFFPRLKQPNPLRDNQVETFVPCGAVAGVFARTDVTRGVWKAPAGVDATLTAVPQLAVALTDNENGRLNPIGVNCLRTFPIIGRVVWGSRTLAGADILADDYKYIPVRRLALYIEESLFRGTQWVVFEPNDEPLWAQIRLNLGAFMHTLFRQGAFQGTSPRDAYLVKCDKETTTQTDINLGIVNIVVGFAPLKPAEFVVIRLQQIAGQIDV